MEKFDSDKIKPPKKVKISLSSDIMKKWKGKFSSVHEKQLDPKKSIRIRRPEKKISSHKMVFSRNTKEEEPQVEVDNIAEDIENEMAQKPPTPAPTPRPSRRIGSATRVMPTFNRQSEAEKTIDMSNLENENFLEYSSIRSRENVNDTFMFSQDDLKSLEDTSTKEQKKRKEERKPLPS